jgi:hypothetical protein
MPVTRTNSIPIEYPNWWFSRITICADDPNADAAAYIDCIPYRVKEDGTNELQYPPNMASAGAAGAACDAKQVTVSGLFAASDFSSVDAQAVLGAVGVALATATPAIKLAAAQMVLYAAIDAVGKDMGAL